MEKTEMMKALEETSEALEIALGRLGCCGNVDGKDHKADVDDYGGMELCARNKELLEKIRNNNIPYVTEAKAYDRLMSGGRKTPKEVANFLGAPIKRERGYGWVVCLDANLPNGMLDEIHEISQLPASLNIDFDYLSCGDSLTLPDGWEDK